ncbi:MAG: hypothetical protein RLZZ500_2576 [Bacteroidota bacterium]|jgi:hypothetical protein
MRQKIKIGLLCDLSVIKQWEVEILNYFINDEFYEVTLLKLNLEVKRKEKKFRQKFKNIPYFITFQIEYLVLKYFRGIKYLDNKSFVNHSVTELDIYGHRDGAKTFLNLDIIDGHFDYLIRVNGIGILVIPDDYSIPILSLHHGDMYSNRGGPAGFWEIIFHQHETSVSLQKLTNELDKGDLLAQYHCRTINFSFVLNQCNVYSVSSRVFDCYFKYAKRVPRPIEVTPILLTIPSFRSICLYYLRILSNICFKITTLNQKWVVCVEQNGKRSVINSKDNSWYADPFFLDDDTIVVEKYLNKKRKGILVSVNLNTLEETHILEEDFHLSHPFVFREKSRVFIIPESLGGGSVKLYELRDHGMFFIKDLLIGRFVDTLVLKVDGGYYLLTTHVDLGFNEEKRLFFSKDLLTMPFIEKLDFQPITNLCYSRSAGVFTLEGDRIINYCQNSYPFYGRSINICEINLKGNITVLQEIKVDSVKYKGIHHYSMIGGKKVYDLRLR